MPRPDQLGSTISILVDGVERADSVVWALTSFEAQMSGMPGTCTVVLRDMEQALDFTTGAVIELIVDGVKLYGGFIMQVQRQYFFPADDTVTDGPEEVESRMWFLQGVDYNILFDKRVLRRPADYTHQIPRTAGPLTDADVVEDHIPLYFEDDDITYDVIHASPPKHTFVNGYRFKDQGTKFRDVMDDLGQYGNVYYIDADKVLHYIPVQDTLADWGISDVPNWEPSVESSASFPTIGFREGEVTEDATGVVNDALVWGGSQWANDGDIVFDRRDDDDSITDHGMWQLSEVHVGEENYKTQDEVTARAKVIVNGDESGTFAEGSKGLVNPEMQFKCTWYAHDVPRALDADPVTDRVHLHPGEVVRIRLYVFGGPLELNVPLRSITITFPTLQGETGNSFVEFTGFFGVLMSDPHWLWSYLRSINKQPQPMLATASNESPNGTYGAMFQDSPSPTANGSVTVFTIPFPYVALTTQVYDNGAIQRRDIDYTESDPIGGEITFLSAPSGPLWVVCYLAG